MGASLIGATKLKLSEIVNWKRLALQEQEELHNLQRHEQSLLAISQKPSVRRPNFTTYTTPISPMEIAIRTMQGTIVIKQLCSASEKTHNPWANLSLWKSSAIFGFTNQWLFTQSEEGKTNNRTKDAAYESGASRRRKAQKQNKFRHPTKLS